MKIVHVEDYFDPSAGYQINELLTAGKNFGDEVYLITSDDMTPFHKEVNKNLDKEFEKENNVTIIRLPSVFRLSSRLVLSGLVRKLKKLEPDLVYLHGIGDFKDLYLFCPKQKFIIVRDCHMSWVASKNRYKKIYFKFFNMFFSRIINKSDKYKVIYALGEEEFQYLRKMGINKEKIEFMPHGYNEKVMYFDQIGRMEIRKGYQISDDSIVISYIGKFDEAKQPDLIFDILNWFDKETIDKYKMKLLFIGPKSKSYMRDFEKKKAVLETKIEIIMDEAKPFKHLRKYYSASDIIIYPKETTLSSIHAQICKNPVIMENHLSNRERVLVNDNLFEINDLEEASEILLEILKNKTYIKENMEIKSFEDREYSKQIFKLRSLVK